MLLALQATSAPSHSWWNWHHVFHLSPRLRPWWSRVFFIPKPWNMTCHHNWDARRVITPSRGPRCPRCTAGGACPASQLRGGRGAFTRVVLGTAFQMPPVVPARELLTGRTQTETGLCIPIISSVLALRPQHRPLPEATGNVTRALGAQKPSHPQGRRAPSPQLRPWFRSSAPRRCCRQRSEGPGRRRAAAPFTVPTTAAWRRGRGLGGRQASPGALLSGRSCPGLLGKAALSFLVREQACVHVPCKALIFNERPGVPGRELHPPPPSSSLSCSFVPCALQTDAFLSGGEGRSSSSREKLGLGMWTRRPPRPWRKSRQRTPSEPPAGSSADFILSP